MSKVYGLMADVHLHSWSAFSETLPSGMNSRLALLLSEIKRCCRETKDAGGSDVVIAGDVFHVRGSVEPAVLNSMIDTLRECNSEFGTKFIVLAGNHDLSGKQANRLGSAVTALECGFVRVCNQVYIERDIGLMLVPWVENIDNLKEEIVALTKLDAYDHREFDLILHAPIDGVIKGLPDHGLAPEWLGSLGFKRVASGHYHNHKRFEGNVYSIGALSHHTWSDIGSKAGFLLVSDSGVNWRKSHLPEFIDLSQLTEMEPEDIPLVVDGNYVRVKVEASKTKDVEAARQELLDMGAKAVIVQALPKPPAREGSEIRPTVASGASLEVSVSDFIGGMYSDAVGGICADVTKAAFAILASIDSGKE
jgi:DNA repair exonuclease SbcCD nuclease subunit